MDATAGIIVFVFVMSIITSFGGNKGFTPPPTGTIYNEVSAVEPKPGFGAVSAENPQFAIEKHILKYRGASEAAAISGSILRHAQANDINPKLVAALITRESKFNPRAVSSSGAMGLGQLLPSTAKGLNVDDPFDIDQNCRGTVRYMKSLLDRFKGKVSSAITPYF